MEPTMGVYQNIPPEALLGGIAACGGVEGYYNYSIMQHQEQQERFRAMAEASGLRAASLYPENSHEIIETAVTEIAKKPLVIINEMLREGLVTPLPDWWAIPSLRRGRIGQSARAHQTMVPDTRGERFQITRDGVSWPIFCTWSNFSFNIRELAIGERVGQPLDTVHIADASYAVNERNEDQAINGLSDEAGNYEVNGNPITIDGLAAPGLLSSTLTFPYATWTTLGGGDIVTVVQDAIELIRLTRPGRPLTLFVPGNYSRRMGDEYVISTNVTNEEAVTNVTVSTGTDTIINRLKKLGPYGGRNLNVVVADSLPDDRVVLVPMDKRDVDLIVGQQLVPLSWTDASGFHTFWVVINCVIFRMFVDKNGEYPVVVGNLE